MEIYITFILYFIIVFSIGLAAFKTTNSHEDYVLGGRRLGAIITALGVGASDMSGWLMIALPGAIYAFGFDHIWMPVGLVLGAYINWRFVGYRLRVFTYEANNSLTIPAYLENRFNDTTKALRTITSVVIIVFFTVYSAAGFVSSALLFSTTFGLNYHTALLFGAVLLVVYTSIGGFLAVNWVDVFQGGLMLFALLILPTFTGYLIYNADPNLLSINYLQNSSLNQFFTKDYFNFIPTGSSLLVFITMASTLAWGLGYFGQPHILVRFMASESKNAIIKARRICMTWMILALLGSISVGIIGKIFFLNSNGIISDPERIFFMLVDVNINPWLAGWFISAILSCIMSTIAAQLLLSSSAIAEDIYRARINPNASNSTLLWLGRLTVVAVAIIAISFAWNKNSSVLTLVGHAWAGLGSSFGPVILISLFWSKMSKESAIAGILTGAITVVLWILARAYFIPDYPSVPVEGQVSVWQIYEIIPGFVMGSLVIFIVGFFYKKPDQATTELYNRAQRICKSS